MGIKESSRIFVPGSTFGVTSFSDLDRTSTIDLASACVSPTFSSAGASEADAAAAGAGELADTVAAAGGVANTAAEDEGADAAANAQQQIEVYIQQIQVPQQVEV